MRIGRLQRRAVTARRHAAVVPPIGAPLARLPGAIRHCGSGLRHAWVMLAPRQVPTFAPVVSIIGTPA
jgi:hypothetical protein